MGKRKIHTTENNSGKNVREKNSFVRVKFKWKFNYPGANERTDQEAEKD